MLHNLLAKYTGSFANVVPFNPARDRLRQLNFTSSNTDITRDILGNTEAFNDYINGLLRPLYLYGIGGYGEHRTVYSRSTVFDDSEEPRRLHLGIDIWGDAGTPVYAPLDGVVHSFGFNNNFGDYGATIILSHRVEDMIFYSLYGHLALRDLAGMEAGRTICRGQHFAHFGEPAENGQWPPHLHFQLIENIGDWKGDYPGVCKFSEREMYLENSPDPDTILNMMSLAEVL